MPIQKAHPDRSKFNETAALPYELRHEDFALAMQDVYDFLFDVNSHLNGKGIRRLDDLLRPAALSGLISDMMAVSLARRSRVLDGNGFHNGHPGLIVDGLHPGNAVRAREHGVEVKSTRKPGGAVDTHGARNQWMCVFVHRIDNATEPATDRAAVRFTEIYLAPVTVDDFRRNPRGELGTRTATLHREGIRKLRRNRMYPDT